MQHQCITKFQGSSQEIGIAIGKSIKHSIINNIEQMIDAIDRTHGIDLNKLKAESLIWLKSLPIEYQQELEGIALGSGCSLEQISEWHYSSMCIEGGCTSFLTKIDNQWWVGRNNDYLLPKAWGFVNIIAVDNQIPVMLFGLEGDIFAGTGFNQEKIWLHYNWLPVWDIPAKGKKVIPPFVFIRKALETCKSIAEIECLLGDTQRAGGMNLFVIDGKTNQATVLECTCQTFQRREIDDFYIAGANHYCTIDFAGKLEIGFQSSIDRQSAVEKLLAKKDNIAVQDMISVLADPRVEQNNRFSGTVYANVACPSREKIWFGYDGFPAASMSNWQELYWEW